MNDIHRDLLSNDLGAICAFLYDVGSGRIEMTDVPSSEEATAAWKADLAHVRDQTAKRRKQLETDGGSEKTHSLIQGWLRDLGLNLGFDVWIASNDRSRQFGEGVLGDGCLKSLDLGDSKDADGIKLIDVLWIKKASDEIIAAFEVEHTTSIYSGILRLSDLALAAAGSSLKGVYLVAPDAREEDVRRQLSRPAFQKITELKFRFLAYSDFEMNRDAMSKFGEGLKAIESVSRVL
jgi:type II restriction enzyme